jgi:hypothetical protein
MRKGHGSHEYLLILAAIHAIAVVVVVVAQSMLSPAQTAADVTSDKYGCGVNGIELVGYDTVYDTGTLPIKYKDTPLSCISDNTVGDTELSAACTIADGTFQIRVNTAGTTCEITDLS